MTFRQNHLSYIWTKRDAFILTGTDSPEYTHTGARVGGWFLLRKTISVESLWENVMTMVVTTES